MARVTLPDGQTPHYPDDATAMDVANGISPRLASAAVAAEVDGQLRDLTRPLGPGEHELKLLTDRDGDPALDVLRHTAAHVLAQAVVRLFGQGVQYTIGPALTDDFQYGFYYDFDLPQPVTTDELPKIEAEMKKVVAEKLPVTREVMSVQDAKQLLRERGQQYKIEMIDDMLADEPATELTFYRQGEFMDMCRGPHLPDTGRLGKAFALMTVAGAYWRGDERNKMLTRIYGTAFFDKKDLAAHLERIEEARKRDHRVLGKQLGLFLLDEKVGPGMPLWLPDGTVVRQELQDWIRGELTRRGYRMVQTPHIGKLDLWKTSGHYPYYRESQFPPIQFAPDHHDSTADAPDHADEGFLLKPMNCPFHLQIYKSRQHSYRDLPLRLAEFGQVYRWEQSGELNGLTRVRSFTQDDAHIFCTPEQIEDEIESCVALAEMVLRKLDLSDYRVRVSLRDPQSDKYVGSEENWQLAEDKLRQVVRKLDMNYSEEVGEAAFYGPKIDFIVKDCIGRDWQLGTIQVDYNLPERFDLEYVGADNQTHRPVMIHRAPFGSFERFIGILIEHYAGAFPLWLAPVQVAVLPVSDKFLDYAHQVVETLRLRDLRVEIDASPDKIGAKIRRATLRKVPVMAVVGQRETDAHTVAVRDRTAGDLGAMDLDRFAQALTDQRRAKTDGPLEPAKTPAAASDTC
jgi:threonyl-tRNA synthetase